MQAVRIQPSPDKDKPYSVTNPASSSALGLDTIDIPLAKEPGDIVVKVHATTVVRDTLTWPEMYAHPYAIPGHDFAGTVYAVHADSNTDVDVDVGQSRGHGFKVGDEVYGMVDASRGQCWAQYVLVKARECALKPKILSFGEAATVPLSALTAWQALFVKGGVPLPVSFGKGDDSGIASGDGNSDGDRNPPKDAVHRKVFITGASGGVGVWIVQLAKMAGCYVVAGTTSKSRSEQHLRGLGADEVVEYTELTGTKSQSRYDTIIDCVAGTTLEHCWSAIKDNGTLVSIHSDSFEFVKTHRTLGIARGKENVNALFFIVEASSADLAVVSRLIEQGKLKTFVAESYPLAEVKMAYDLCHVNSGSRGKVVLVP